MAANVTGSGGETRAHRSDIDASHVTEVALRTTRDQRTRYATAPSVAFMTVIDVKSRKATALIEVGRGSSCVRIDD